MPNLSRREWIGALAATALGAPLGMPVGCQTYPVREALAQDFAGTLRKLRAIGYRRIEMCSPPGYEKGGYGFLVGKSAAELKHAIHAAGLGCESCHYTFRELKEHVDDRIRFARQLGLKQMVVATFGVPASAPLADWTAAARDLNAIARSIQSAGMRTVFHNHHFEFREIGGALIYDHLMETLDPKLVFMQFQLSVISAGYDAAKFMRKYPGRFASLHLQDWSQKDQKQVAVGQGIVDWKAVFAAARSGGIRNYFVELPMAELEPSYRYLKPLRV